MNNVFELTNDKSWKTMLVQDDRLFFINKSYSTVEDFFKGYNDDSLLRHLKQKMEVNIMDITSLSHDAKDADELNINYAGTAINLDFAKTDALKEVTDFIVSKRNFSSQVQTVSKFDAIKAPLIGLGITALLGWLLYSEAEVIESGGSVSITGRRRLFKQILAWAAGALGTTGTIIVASISAIICGYFIYRNLKTPPNEVVYQ